MSISRPTAQQSVQRYHLDSVNAELITEAKKIQNDLREKLLKKFANKLSPRYVLGWGDLFGSLDLLEAARELRETCEISVSSVIDILNFIDQLQIEKNKNIKQLLNEFGINTENLKSHLSKNIKRSYEKADFLCQFLSCLIAKENDLQLLEYQMLNDNNGVYEVIIGKYTKQIESIKEQLNDSIFRGWHEEIEKALLSIDNKHTSNVRDLKIKFLNQQLDFYKKRKMEFSIYSHLNKGETRGLDLKQKILFELLYEIIHDFIADLCHQEKNYFLEWYIKKLMEHGCVNTEKKKEQYKFIYEESRLVLSEGLKKNIKDAEGKIERTIVIQPLLNDFVRDLELLLVDVKNESSKKIKSKIGQVFEHANTKLQNNQPKEYADAICQAWQEKLNKLKDKLTKKIVAANRIVYPRNRKNNLPQTVENDLSEKAALIPIYLKGAYQTRDAITGVGVFEMCGERPTQEDEAIYGKLPDEINQLTDDQIKFAIKKTIAQLQEEIEKEGLQGGSTLCVNLVIHKDGRRKIFTANVGDSTAFLCEETAGEFSTKPLNKIHTPDDPSEKERIIRNGGEVFKDDYGIARIRFTKNSSGIAMSRAMGDCHYGARISHEPDVDLKEVSLDARIYLITACDGMTETKQKGKPDSPVLNDKRIAEIVKSHQGETAEVIANALCMAGYAAGSNDNITVLCSRGDQHENYFQGIFDGHNGNTVSKKLKQRFPEVLTDQLKLAHTYQPPVHRQAANDHETPHQKTNENNKKNKKTKKIKPKDNKIKSITHDPSNAEVTTKDGGNNTHSDVNQTGSNKSSGWKTAGWLLAGALLGAGIILSLVFTSGALTPAVLFIGFGILKTSVGVAVASGIGTAVLSAGGALSGAFMSAVLKWGYQSVARSYETSRTKTASKRTMKQPIQNENDKKNNQSGVDPNLLSSTTSTFKAIGVTTQTLEIASTVQTHEADKQEITNNNLVDSDMSKLEASSTQEILESQKDKRATPTPTPTPTPTKTPIADGDLTSQDSPQNSPHLVLT